MITVKPTTLRPSLIMTVFCVCAILLTLTISCKKEDKEDTDEYYVKYEVNSSSIYTGQKLNVTYTNDKGQSTSTQINARTKWETIVGPVKKGFNASMRIKTDGSATSLTMSAQISVSKNSSAFAVKNTNASIASQSSLNVNYSVDY